MQLASSWNDQLATALCVGIVTALAITLIKYRKDVRDRLRRLDVLCMVRVVDSSDAPVNPKMNQVELNPEFVEKCQDYPKMISLGGYLSSLRPYLATNQNVPDWIEEAIQNAITKALLRALGPRLGTILLPVVGSSVVQKVVDRIVELVVVHTTVSSEKRGTVPLPLSAIPGIAQLNYELRKPTTYISKDPKVWKHSASSPLYLFRGGEVGFSPSFSEVVTPPASADKLLVPNPFVISKDWNKAIAGMESLLLKAGTDTTWKSTPMEESPEDDQVHAGAFIYDAQSRAMKPPVPIDERWLPDLYLGWGSALCTHTHQEVLKNRLLSVLLNRLAANVVYSDEQTPFQVFVDESCKAMTRPTELIQALIDMGHSIEACVRSNITTFGVALCIKENDGSFINVPLAFFLHNGYKDAEGKEAFACMPHSGLNVEIRGGPLLQHCSIQHYIAIEGICGWNSNHNADVPWMQDVDCGQVMRGSKMIESIRVAAMEAIIFNATGATLQLPHGGYGLTGVCNDSAAMIQYALFGKVDVYPLTLNGQFAIQNLRSAMSLRDKLRADSSMKREIDAINRLIKSLLVLPSDTNSLPNEAASQIRRQLHVQQPKLPFLMMQDNVQILGSIKKEIESAL